MQSEHKRYYRESEIVTCLKEGIEGILPISRSVWRRGVKDGSFPKPVRFAERGNFWTVESIQKLINDVNSGQ